MRKKNVVATDKDETFHSGCSLLNAFKYTDIP
jgi:hypothetical protein